MERGLSHRKIGFIETFDNKRCVINGNKRVYWVFEKLAVHCPIRFEELVDDPIRLGDI